MPQSKIVCVRCQYTFEEASERCPKCATLNDAVVQVSDSTSTAQIEKSNFHNSNVWKILTLALVTMLFIVFGVSLYFSDKSTNTQNKEEPPKEQTKRDARPKKENAVKGLNDTFNTDDLERFYFTIEGNDEEILRANAAPLKKKPIDPNRIIVVGCDSIVSAGFIFLEVDQFDKVTKYRINELLNQNRTEIEDIRKQLNHPPCFSSDMQGNNSKNLDSRNTNIIEGKKSNDNFFASSEVCNYTKRTVLDGYGGFQQHWIKADNPSSNYYCSPSEQSIKIDTGNVDDELSISYSAVGNSQGSIKISVDYWISSKVTISESNDQFMRTKLFIPFCNEITKKSLKNPLPKRVIEKLQNKKRIGFPTGTKSEPTCEKLGKGFVCVEENRSQSNNLVGFRILANEEAYQSYINGEI